VTPIRLPHALALLTCGALWTSCASTPPAPAPLPPLIIAHRGASADAPENTLAAYSLAIEHGAKMAECDVYLSRDGVPVLIHDRELERTTSGTGEVGQFTVAELKMLDAGSWKDPSFADERIPTLVEFLRLLKGQMRPVIEIKGQDEGMAEAVVAAMREADMPPEDVMIFSFHHAIVAEIVELEPLLPAAWLLDGPAEDDAARRAVLRKALSARVTVIGTSEKDFDPQLLRLAHECGLSIFVWTVDDPKRMNELRSEGVDALITNRPALALSVMGDATAR